MTIKEKRDRLVSELGEDWVAEQVVSWATRSVARTNITRRHPCRPEEKEEAI